MFVLLTFVSIEFKINSKNSHWSLYFDLIHSSYRHESSMALGTPLIRRSILVLRWCQTTSTVLVWCPSFVTYSWEWFIVIWLYPNIRRVRYPAHYSSVNIVEPWATSCIINGISVCLSLRSTIKILDSSKVRRPSSLTEHSHIPTTQGPSMRLAYLSLIEWLSETSSS